jgi:tripartite-type tricarboxylate transporter receptor subunit TctC
MNLNRRLLCLAVAWLAATMMPARTHAQDSWPTKPIHFLVSAAPGSTPDVLARIIADRLKDSLKVPIVVENQGGVGGILAHANLANAAPDGYTILLSFTGAMVYSPYLYKNVRFDPNKSFAPIVIISTAPNLLLISNSLPVNNVPEFVDLLKKNPGKYNYSSASAGTSSHLAMELFKIRTGVDIVHVPYKSAPDAMRSLITGDTHANMAIPSPTVNSFVVAKQLKLLATTGTTRYPLNPDVPTFVESGYPDFVLEPWNGVLAPAETPKPIVDRLNREINDAIRSPDMNERLRGMGVVPRGSTTEEFSRIIREDTERWSRVIRGLGISVE